VDWKAFGLVDAAVVGALCIVVPQLAYWCVRRIGVIRINENELAQCVAEREGKTINLPIGQIKEVQRNLLDILSGYDVIAVLMLLRKHRERVAESLARTKK